MSLVAPTDSFGVTMLLTFGIHCHFFRQNVYELLPAYRPPVRFHLMFHTDLVVSHHVSHTSGRVALPYCIFTLTAIFSWLIAIIFDLASRGYCLHHGVPRPDLSI